MTVAHVPEQVEIVVQDKKIRERKHLKYLGTRNMKIELEILSGISKVSVLCRISSLQLEDSGKTNEDENM